jgi:hypothetical protein
MFRDSAIAVSAKSHSKEVDVDLQDARSNIHENFWARTVLLDRPEYGK